MSAPQFTPPGGPWRPVPHRHRTRRTERGGRAFVVLLVALFAPTVYGLFQFLAGHDGARQPAAGPPGIFRPAPSRAAVPAASTPPASPAMPTALPPASLPTQAPAKTVAGSAAATVVVSYQITSSDPYGDYPSFSARITLVASGPVTGWTLTLRFDDASVTAMSGGKGDTTGHHVAVTGTSATASITPAHPAVLQLWANGYPAWPADCGFDHQACTFGAPPAY